MYFPIILVYLEPGLQSSHLKMILKILKYLHGH